MQGTFMSNWVNVTAELSGTLWVLLHQNPRMLVEQYARVVLDKRWRTSIQCDKRDPDKLLRDDEVTFAFFQEDEAIFSEWVDGLKSPVPLFQQAATQKFAAKLVTILRQNVTEG